MCAVMAEGQKLYLEAQPRLLFRLALHCTTNQAKQAAASQSRLACDLPMPHQHPPLPFTYTSAGPHLALIVFGVGSFEQAFILVQHALHFFGGCSRRSCRGLDSRGLLRSRGLGSLGLSRLSCFRDRCRLGHGDHVSCPRGRLSWDCIMLGRCVSSGGGWLCWIHLVVLVSPSTKPPLTVKLGASPDTVYHKFYASTLKSSGGGRTGQGR